MPNINTGVDITSPGITDTERYKNIRSQAPIGLLHEAQRWANEGLYSPQDIQSIFGTARQINSSQRANILRGATASWGRSLGSRRAGALRQMIANRITGPANIALLKAFLALKQRNVESRAGGFDRIASFLDYIENRESAREERERSGGLGGLLGGIAGVIPGASAVYDLLSGGGGRKEYD